MTKYGVVEKRGSYGGFFTYEVEANSPKEALENTKTNYTGDYEVWVKVAKGHINVSEPVRVVVDVEEIVE